MGRKKYRSNYHNRSRLTAHLVWGTKYRHKVLRGAIQERCRELLIQTCDSLEVEILKGVMAKDHIHMHIEYPPHLSISEITKRLKGRSSRRMQEEFPSLRKWYWGRHFWAIGYAVWSTGEITGKMVQDYLEHHRSGPDTRKGPIILE